MKQLKSFRYSADFGGSTLDVIRWEDHRIVDCRSYERQERGEASLSSFFLKKYPDLTAVQSIRVTGGKSHAFPALLEGVPVGRVDEIQSIGWGGQWLLREMGRSDPRALIVSLGTGTCMVKMEEDKMMHVGGTGVGGGTFLSLSRLLLQEENPDRLVELFQQGDSRKVDLSVGEIVGRDIGLIGRNDTASNLGKLGFSKEIDFSNADLAAGIVNLVGQTIATAAVFAAKAESLPLIVLTGKLTRITPIVKIIEALGQRYGKEVVVPPRAEVVSAIGAGVFES